MKFDDWNRAEFNNLKGETIKNIVQGDQEILFTLSDGTMLRMYHEQDCCEDVHIEDICGDLDDLLNTPITYADESTNEGDSAYGHETWTFYRIGTDRGSVTIRWYGESNGYYSESVSLQKV